jgi:hypothetical protein
MAGIDFEKGCLENRTKDIERKKADCERNAFLCFFQKKMAFFLLSLSVSRPEG